MRATPACYLARIGRVVKDSQTRHYHITIERSPSTINSMSVRREPRYFLITAPFTVVFVLDNAVIINLSVRASQLDKLRPSNRPTDQLADRPTDVPLADLNPDLNHDYSRVSGRCSILTTLTRRGHPDGRETKAPVDP